VILRVAALLVVLAAAHGSLLREVLFAALLLVGYVALVLVRPTKRCPACWGRKLARKGQRMVPCARCDMTGRVKRLGATLVHRVFWRVAGDALADRRKLANALRRAEYAVPGDQGKQPEKMGAPTP
jgi:hypothetical protein